ncbi:FKBP-type peptidyl-prolyl cis-trans isomerase, partial [Bacteroidota bacterium]
FNMEIRDNNDSVFYSTINNGFPDMIFYDDTTWESSGQIYEGLKKMRVGDSAVFKITCHNLYKLSWRREVPGNMDGEATLTVNVGIQDLITPYQYQYQEGIRIVKKREIQAKKAEDQLFKDLALMDDYFENNAIIPLETESGMRYVIHDEGDGINPEIGDEVTVHFTGYFLDGTIFDDTYSRGPMRFRIGAGTVIDGWAEGVKLMSKGARFTFYMPSGIAYGLKGYRNIIDPNQILVYEAVMVDIKFR